MISGSNGTLARERGDLGRGGRRVLLAAGLAVASALVAACGSSGSPAPAGSSSGGSEPIKIAVLSDSTGALAFFGIRANQGWDLALEKIGGKIGNHPVQYIKVQCATPVDCAADTDRVIKEQGASMVMGTPGSALALGISQAAAKDGVVYFETASLVNTLLPPGPAKTIFRAAPNDDLLGAGALDAVQQSYAKMGKTVTGATAVIVNESSASNHNQAQVQERVLKGIGVKVLDHVEYDVQSADYSALAAKVVSLHPDILVETSYVKDFISFNTELAQRHFKPGLFVSSGTPANDELTALGADYLEGLQAISFPILDSNEKGAPGIGDFLQAYQKKFGKAPDAPYALTYYSSALILFDVLKATNGSTKPADFRTAVLSMDKPLGTYPTGWGARFNENGQNERARPSSLQWQKGKTCTVVPLELASCALEVTAS